MAALTLTLTLALTLTLTLILTLTLTLTLALTLSRYDPWQLSSIGELKSFAFLKEHGK